LRLFLEKPSVSHNFLLKRLRNPMGDSQNHALRVDFHRQIKLEFHGSTVTRDAGLLAHSELDDALGLTSTSRTAERNPISVPVPDSFFSNSVQNRGSNRREPVVVSRASVSSPPE
jgi:hypothetical protein